MTGEFHHCSSVLYCEILSVLQFTSFTGLFTNNYVTRTKYNWGNILTSYSCQGRLLLFADCPTTSSPPGPRQRGRTNEKLLLKPKKNNPKKEKNIKLLSC